MSLDNNIINICNIEEAYNSLNVANSCCVKAQKSGTLELDEAYYVKISIDSISFVIKSLEDLQKSFTEMQERNNNKDLPGQYTIKMCEIDKAHNAFKVIRACCEKSLKAGAVELHDAYLTKLSLDNIEIIIQSLNTLQQNFLKIYEEQKKIKQEQENKKVQEEENKKVQEEENKKVQEEENKKVQEVEDITEVINVNGESLQIQ
jgi:hypothetical protein